MTEEQYKFTIQYRGIIELFAKTGQYIGGAESLFEYYKIIGQERSCPSCISRFLLERNNEIKQYEKQLIK